MADRSINPANDQDWRPTAARGLGRRAFLACALGGIPVVLGGCAHFRASKVALPERHTIVGDQLQIISDFKLGKDEPLVADLKALRKQVSERLELPLGTKTVTVYLFSNRDQYRNYLHAAFPGYPERRAYFIQTPGKQLAVYTWWGERIQEDLRHEYTHGLLHAALESVPLWLDEGLAEYFEVAGPAPGRINNEHAQKLALAVQNGWHPDLDRLESLEKVNQTNHEDYREAWAWVHFMLHASPDTRMILLNYIHDLRTNPKPGLFHERIVAEIPDVDRRLVSYVATMTGAGAYVPTVHRASAQSPGHR